MNYGYISEIFNQEYDKTPTHKVFVYEDDLEKALELVSNAYYGKLVVGGKRALTKDINVKGHIHTMY